MADDPIAEFLNGLTPEARDVAEQLIAIISGHAKLEAAIKWRQLTFALHGDFDHWICAVASTKRATNLTFHFGSMLADTTGAFAPSDAKYVRKVSFATAGDVDGDVVRDLLTQALDTLPQFRCQARPG